MAAEPFTYTAPCGGCGLDAQWHATPAGSGGRDTTRVDCPGCGADPPEPEPVPPALPHRDRPCCVRRSAPPSVGALIAATARKVLP